jgi:hypothetical protein
MKLCARCKTEKQASDFALRNKAKGTFQPYCKICRKDMDAKIWQENAAFRERKLSRTKGYRLRNRQFVLQYLLQHPCVDCGESDPIVLDFDHQRDKKKGVASMMESATTEALQEEILKCEVRCANCHRRKTAKDRGYFRYIQGAG